ncbi:MAG: WD40 repeat domain-containing serine/threonine protein kinase [Planctomycetota bacterium]|jgi:WD40 repeat protein/serine/threonine protein kinase
MAEGSEPQDAVAGAEAAFASYLARVKHGEQIDFESFCAERPALADSLRVLFDAWHSTSGARNAETIGEFLSNQQERGNISLDPEAPPEDSGSGIQERLAQLGRRTGRYNLREEVARGGMGVILKIWDKDLRRTLAMKASFHHFRGDDGEVPAAAQEIVARFVDEAQITAQLDHPGIVPVHELGVDNDGRMYFTMRLVKGHTLDEIIRLARADKEGWNRPRAVGVMVKVCEAMAYAHAKGVIHRDLKPANVMVGDFGEVYVMDWGLAKVLGRHDPHQRAWQAAASVLRTQVRTDRADDLMATPNSPLLTMEGMVIGTPTYMPPEQAEGRIDALDPRSDVYSVGALLYTLLTGRMPYVDPSEPPTAGKVLMALIEGPPTPVLELDASIPPELVAICDKAMARNPNERYENMGEMAEDLRAFVENRVVRAYASGPVAEFRKWVHRNRAVAASILLVVLVSLGAAFYVAWEQNRKAGELSEAKKTVDIALAKSERNEKRALESAEEARQNAVRAERQSYLASLAAAHGQLRMSEIVEARDRLDDCPKEYRGWEWDYLWYATDTSERVLDGGHGRVTAVHFSPDGARIVVGTADKGIRIWDLESGNSFPLPDAPQAVTALVVSRDGSRIAAASKGPNVRVWDAGAAKLERMLPHEGDVTSIAFLDEEGTRIVTADDEGAHLWDVPKQQRIASLEHDDIVFAVAASEDGKWIVTADEVGVHIFDAATREQAHLIELEEGATCVAVGHGTIAAGSLDEMVRLISLGSGEVLHTLAGHSDPVTAVHFSPDGKKVASSSFDRTLRVWDVEGGHLVEVLRGHGDPVRSLHCVEQSLVSGSDDGTLRLWRPQAGGQVLTLRGDEDFLAAVAFDPRRGHVAAASAGHGEIRIWDKATGADVKYIPEKGDRLSSLAYSPDGKWIVAGSEDGTGRVHDAETGELVATLTGHTVSVTSIAVDASSRRVVTGSADQSVRIWSIDGSGEATVLKGHAARVQAVAFGPDGTVASADDAGVVILWESGKPRRLTGHQGAVFGVAFSPDGKSLATAGADHTIRLWNAVDGAEQEVLRGHGGKVRAVSYHPDGSRLASASEDKTVRIWDAGTGDSLLRLLAHGEWVTSVAFSPDGKSLATASFDTTAKVWRTQAPR